jgi:two-component system, OmpR family, response regulator
VKKENEVKIPAQEDPLPAVNALIIDDEADVGFLLSGILKQKNIRPVFARSLAEADKALQSNPGFVYIFLDNHLPDGYGTAHIKRLKASLPGCRLIMITAYDTTADRMNAELNGVDSFLGKPFSKEAIFSAIDRLRA